MITPEPLKTGDKIGIAAPARKISADELQYTMKLFYEWGFETELASNLFLSHHQYAGTDNERLAGFQQLLDKPEVKAIICARGGYGSVRIIDRLDFSAFVKKPKWIIGYSDVTVFHSHIHRNFGIQTIHSSMPINFLNNTPEALNSLRNALSGQKESFHIPPHPLNRAGSAEGVLTGGNLSMIYALSNTPSDIDTNGKILFIEDLEEYLYHIDRMMFQLDRCGKLKQLSGLIVGGMENMNDNAIPFGKEACQIISDVCSKYGFPVCFGFPAGHINDNRALILGATATLTVSNTGTNLGYL